LSQPTLSIESTNTWHRVNQHLA